MRIAVLVLLAVLCVGCATAEKMGSDILAASRKIDRRVVLYSALGDTIRVWEGPLYIEDGNGSGIDFLLHGKRFSLSGTWTVEELP